MCAPLLAQTNNILEEHLFKSTKALLDNLLKNFSITEELKNDITTFVKNPGQTSFADKIKEIRTNMQAVNKCTEPHILLDNIHKFFMGILPDNDDIKKHLQQIKRISTYIEFISKYHNPSFFIEKWITGSYSLELQLSDCQKHIKNEKMKAAVVATTVGVAAVGCTATAATGILTTSTLAAGGQAVAASTAGQAVIGAVTTGGQAVISAGTAAVNFVAGHGVASAVVSGAAGTTVGVVIGRTTGKDNNASDQRSQPNKDKED